MPARAIWKGVIRFGDVDVPVKLYSAVEDRNIHFRLLHDQDMTPLKQTMVHPRTGEQVPRDQMLRGVEVSRGRFVILRPEEQAKLEPPAGRSIQIERFVPTQQINDQWYDRPYYLGPDGEEDTFGAFAEALERQGSEGVARWTMRRTEYVGSLRVHRGRLMLITLRHAEEVVRAGQLPAPQGRPLDAKEMDLAERLIEALQGDFDPGQWHDEYRKRVRELVEAKARGARIELKQFERKPAPESLLGMLEASLAGAKGE